MLPEENTYVNIISYKHDGHIRRSWDQGFVLEANDERYIIVTNKTWVEDDDGHKWFTREPAICYFYPDRWFNVIAMLRETGTYYYCNLASPVLYDGKAVKYIDYDLDYKIYPDGTVMLLDENEYRLHRRKMHYPEQIDPILRKYMKMIVDLYDKKRECFDHKDNEERFRQYLEILSK